MASNGCTQSARILWTICWRDLAEIIENKDDNLFFTQRTETKMQKFFHQELKRIKTLQSILLIRILFFSTW